MVMSCAAAKVTVPGSATEAANTTAVQVSFVIKFSLKQFFQVSFSAQRDGTLFAAHHRASIAAIQTEIVGLLQCPPPLPLV
jgi:hypothetical protein